MSLMELKILYNKALVTDLIGKNCKIIFLEEILLIKEFLFKYY